MRQKASIFFTGELRGNPDNWNTIYNFFEKYFEYRIYIGSYNPEFWEKFPLKGEMYKTSVIENTKIPFFWHNDADKYLRNQWSHLYLTYKYFSKNIKDDEIIIKFRNDFYIEENNELDFTNLLEHTIYVPEKEYHETQPFYESNICNDQIIIGRKSAMAKYFNFPYDIKLESIDRSRWGSLSIESALRAYLYQQYIHLKTIKLNYYK